MRNEILQGDVSEQLRRLASGSVNCVVTSPPYWGKRDYGTGEWEGGSVECDHKPGSLSRASGSTLAGGHNHGGHLLEGYKAICAKCGAVRKDRQLGLEATLEAYVARLVEVFREIRRVLRDDGTCWLNLGDSYAAGTKAKHSAHSKNSIIGANIQEAQNEVPRSGTPDGLKTKDLVGIPWMVAFALRADGWYLRSDIIWQKKNPMPESVTDRPTSSHEHIFLLTKSARYWYDADAIREKHTRVWDETNGRGIYAGKNNLDQKQDDAVGLPHPAGRNKRTVWTIASKPYKAAHFATFPPKLIEPCILAGCPSRVCVECGEPWVRVAEKTAATPGQNIGYTAGTKVRNDGDRAGYWVDMKTKTTGHTPQCQCNAPHRPCIVLDPFIGSGTTAQVAIENKRDWLGIELNPDYIKLADERIRRTQPPLFVAEEAQIAPGNNELYELAAERDALKKRIENIDNRIKELI